MLLLSVKVAIKFGNYAHSWLIIIATPSAAKQSSCKLLFSFSFANLYSSSKYIYFTSLFQIFLIYTIIIFDFFQNVLYNTVKN